MEKIFWLAGAIAAFGGVAALWLLSMKKTLYRFRNLALCGLAGAILLFAISLCVDFPETVTKSALLYFPERLAGAAAFLFLLLGLLMLGSNFELMSREGICARNAVGSLLGAAVVAAAIVVRQLSGWLAALGTQSASALVQYLLRAASLSAFCLLDYFDCILFGMIIMGVIAARQTPKYDKDYILILGCSISKKGGLLPLLKGRTDRAVRYAWQQEIATGKKLCYVPSGGQGSDEIMSEGSAMELYLLAHSAQAEEILAEKKSTNTYENFAFSKKLIDAQKKDAKIAFSTTNYHVLRSGMIANRLGMSSEAIASRTKWYFWPNGFAREAIAIFAMTKCWHLLAGIAIVLLSCLLAI